MEHKVIEDLKELLVKGIEPTLVQLKEVFKKGNEEYDEIILIFARYEDIKKEIHHNRISTENKQIELAKIRAALLYIINKINSSNINIQWSEVQYTSNISEKFDLKKSQRLSNYNNPLDVSRKEIKSSFEELMVTLKVINQISNRSSNAFGEGAEKMNQMVGLGNINILEIIKIDENIAYELEIYTRQINKILPDYDIISNKLISDYLIYIQALSFEDENISLSNFKDSLQYIKSIGKTTKSIRKNLYGLSLELKRVQDGQHTQKMKAATIGGIEANDKLIESIRTFYIYIDRFEELLELKILEKTKRKNLH